MQAWGSVPLGGTVMSQAPDSHPQLGSCVWTTEAQAQRVQGDLLWAAPRVREAKVARGPPAKLDPALGGLQTGTSGLQAERPAQKAKRPTLFGQVRPPWTVTSPSGPLLPAKEEGLDLTRLSPLLIGGFQAPLDGPRLGSPALSRGWNRWPQGSFQLCDSVPCAPGA